MEPNRQTSTTSPPNEGFLFFTARWQLRGSLPAELVTEEVPAAEVFVQPASSERLSADERAHPGEGAAADMAQRLIPVLVNPSDGFSWRELAWGFSSHTRLNRARWLLAQVETGRADRASKQSRELWDWLESEWKWAGRSGFVHGVLAKVAKEMGLSDSANPAHAVQQAIGAELLPGLRLKRFLLGVGRNQSQTRPAVFDHCTPAATVSMCGANRLRPLVCGFSPSTDPSRRGTVHGGLE